jgi:hypothetical protein
MDEICHISCHGTMMDEQYQVKLSEKHIDNDFANFTTDIAKPTITKVMTTELTSESTNLSQFGRLF